MVFFWYLLFLYSLSCITVIQWCCTQRIIYGFSFKFLSKVKWRELWSRFLEDIKSASQEQIDHLCVFLDHPENNLFSAVGNYITHLFFFVFCFFLCSIKICINVILSKLESVTNTASKIHWWLLVVFLPYNMTYKVLHNLSISQLHLLQSIA